MEPKSLNGAKRNLSLKEWAGFDFAKSLDWTIDYVLSAAYAAILNDFFGEEFGTQERSQIQQALSTGISLGEGISQIADRINLIVQDPDRAWNIARTESIRVLNWGALDRVQEMGAEKGAWMSAPEDGRLCDECASLDGQEFDIDELKEMIPLHPECRCTFTVKND